ncbi:MAG: PspC domain-containing protein [Actinomadura rubrobrunea]|nr:PspC domain-containing protein [Actinomadura rubrobrunea]
MDKSPHKKLTRTREGRMIAGVCSGVGRYLGIDPTIVRIGLAAFNVFGGAGVALYAIAWLLIPEEGAATSVAEDLVEQGRKSPIVQDAVQKAKDALNTNRSGS